MKTVLDPLGSALDALDAEIRRLTTTRDDLASLIEQMRGDPPSPERSLPAAATRKAARTGDGARRPRLVPTTTTPPRSAPARRPQTEKPCPVPGCGKSCANGTGLAAHLRGAHPDYVARRVAATEAFANIEQGLAAL